MSHRNFVFLGPSLRSPERAEWARHLEILPPVAAGDLLRLPLQPGDTVGIVDGYFRSRPAVRHKEILDLIERGVHVHGSASMGALRAAELNAFGMIGHGKIFADYRDGILVADDEVALVHGTAEEDYFPYTLALVNVRHALATAVAAGELPVQAAEAIIDAGRRLPFIDRTYEAIMALADESLMGSTANVVRKILKDGEDLKRRDTLQLLRFLINPLSQNASSSQEWQLRRTRHLRTWHSEATGEHHLEAGFILDTQVHDFCRVEATDYPKFREQTALSALLASPAFPPAYRSALETNKDPSPWTGYTWPPPRSSPESEEELHQAAAQRLYEEGLATRNGDGLDGWEAWSTKMDALLPRSTQLAKAASRAFFTDEILLWADPFLVALKDSGIFNRARSALAHILLFNRQLMTQNPGINLARLSHARIHDWYAQRWDRVGDFPDAVLERGFPSISKFTRTASFYYLHSRHCLNCQIFTMETRQGEPGNLASPCKG